MYALDWGHAQKTPGKTKLSALTVRFHENRRFESKGTENSH